MRQFIWASCIHAVRLLTPLIGCRTSSRSWLVRHDSDSIGGASVSVFYLLLAIGVNAGCHASTPGNCELECNLGHNDQCINGMVCGNAGLCVDPNWTGPCTTSSVGGSSGTGGAKGNAGGSGTAGGNAVGGAVSGSGGNGGQPKTGTTTGSGGPSSGGKPGSTAVDSNVLGLGGETSAGSSSDTTSSGGSAGASTVGSGGTGLGATTDTAGTPQGGASGKATGTVQVTVAPPSPWCVGTAYNAVLTAGGGGPVFKWYTSSTAPGLVLGASSSSTNSLTGTPTQAGHYDSLLEVTDDVDEAGTLNLLINNGPTITTTMLPDACQGEVFSVDLSATDVNIGDLEWTGTLPPILGLTLTSNGTLSGVLQQVGDFQFSVNVRNKVTTCTSSTQRFELNVHDGSLTDCPTIGIENLGVDALAPPACRGWPYAIETLDSVNAVPIKLVASGGTAPYTWQATGLPPGLDFNAATHEVTGTATASGNISVQLTDSKQRTIQKSYSVPVREKCWLAYTSEYTGAKTLNLFDPYLGSRLRRPNSNADTALDSISDFAFSPNGKFIAYRSQDTGGNQKLTLWQGPTWDREQELSFDGSVTHYSWSDNSRVLAVAYRASGGVMLGGANVELVPDTPTVPGIQGVRMLAPASAPVESEITWYGRDGYVAFSYQVTSPNVNAVAYASYNENGFLKPSLPAELYESSIVIYPGVNGFFATPSGETILPSLNFYGIDSDKTVLHGNDGVAPSGAFTASSDGKSLLLYRPSDGSEALDSSNEPPWASTTGCSSLLTWAKQQERLVCADSSTASVSVHTLNPSVAQFSDSALAVEDSQNVEGSWRGNRRLIAPSGDWLALVADNKLFLAALDRTTPAVVWNTSLSGTQVATDLSFSPDEQLLVMLRGASLRLYETGFSGASSYDGYAISDLNQNADACQDDWQMLPDWCGSERHASPIRWSPDSQLMAFVQSDGNLTIRDLRQWRETGGGVIQTIDVAANCNDDCDREFLFQP